MGALPETVFLCLPGEESFLLRMKNSAALRELFCDGKEDAVLLLISVCMLRAYADEYKITWGRAGKEKKGKQRKVKKRTGQERKEKKRRGKK